MPCEDFSYSLMKAMAGSEDGLEEIKDCRSFLREEVTELKERLTLAKASIKELHALPVAIRKHGLDEVDLVKLAMFEVSRRAERAFPTGEEIRGKRLLGRALGTERTFLLIAYCEGCRGERQGSLRNSMGYFVQLDEVIIAEITLGDRAKVIAELEELIR
jgi:hypothetical protein